MSDAVWTALVAAVAGGIVAVLVAWLNEFVSRSRRQRQFERLELCLRLRREYADDDTTLSLAEREIAHLFAALDHAPRQRPRLASAVQYLVGLVAVAFPIAVAVLIFMPETRERPWLFAAILLPTAVIYAIESQPMFLRPLVGRWAPRRYHSPPSKQRSAK